MTEAVLDWRWNSKKSIEADGGKPGDCRGIVVETNALFAKAFEAFCNDPMTAKLNRKQAGLLFEEMFEKTKAYLPGYEK